ncbi:MAG: endonuclease [Bryobacterales bacterium]|nr:endonuclease [Bryobacterales bacterium]
MATGPRFEPADALPARDGDMLDVVAGIDRELNKLAAAKAIALDLAHRAHVEQVAPSRAGASLADGTSRDGARFDSAVLAERSFRAEVAALLAISERAAENLIGVSGALVKTLPATMKALADGDISWRHATIMVDETAGLDSDSQARLEIQVLGRPDRLTPPKFARVLRKAREELNPETIVERHLAAREDRGVSIDDVRDGMSDLIIRLGSVHAHAIYNKATTAARMMDDPLEDRTLDQRRADILTHVLLATVDGEAFGVIPDEWDDTNFVRWFRGITAEVAVTVPVLTLLGESETPATLDGWVPIDPITARILASEAKGFIRLLTHPETGVVLSVGRKRYKVPKDLRRFLQIRDLTCRFPGCGIAAQRSDIDHTLDWQYEGETEHANLAHLCRPHHTVKGNTTWTVTQATDGSGVLTWTTPTGRTYRTYPHTPIAA